MDKSETFSQKIEDILVLFLESPINEWIQK